MSTQSNAVTEAVEYICISCWTSFVAKANDSGEVTCPHCDYLQPAAEDYLDANQSDPPPPSVSSPPASISATTDVDMTMRDIKMPWAEMDTSDPLAQAQAPGLEAISFDDMDELDELLGKASEEVAPTENSAAPAADEAPPVAEVAPPAAETTEKPETASTVWRLKSAAGLTYNFYDFHSLTKWADGLEKPEKAQVSIDGISWKVLSSVREKIADGDTALETYKSTAVQRPKQAPPPKRTTNTSVRRDRNSKAQRRSASAIRTAAKAKRTSDERKRAANALQLAAEQAAAEAPRGGSGTAQRRRTGRTQTTTGQSRKGKQAAASSWSGRLLFMALGASVGGAGVYFGMYLLGFYDLTFF